MNIDMIRAAALRLEGNVVRTPLLSSPGLDAIAGRRVRAITPRVSPGPHRPTALAPSL